MQAQEISQTPGITGNTFKAVSLKNLTEQIEAGIRSCDSLAQEAKTKKDREYWEARAAGKRAVLKYDIKMAIAMDNFDYPRKSSGWGKE